MNSSLLQRLHDFIIRVGPTNAALALMIVSVIIALLAPLL